MTHGHVWIPWWWLIQHPPHRHLFFFTTFYVFLVSITELKKAATLVLSEESIFCGVTASQSPLATDPSYTSLQIQIHSHQYNPFFDKHWSNCLVLIMGVHRIFLSCTPPLIPPSASSHPWFTLSQYFPINSNQEASHLTCVCACMHMAWRVGRHLPELTSHPSWYQDCLQFRMLAQPPPHHNYLFPNLYHPHRDQVLRALWENWSCEEGIAVCYQNFRFYCSRPVLYLLLCRCCRFLDPFISIQRW